MKNSYKIAVFAAAAILTMSACGGTSGDNAASDQDTQTDGSNADAGQTSDESSQASSENGNPTDTDTIQGASSKSGTDAITGEWSYYCTLYHSADSDGNDYDYVTMCVDDMAPESRISIKNENGKYIADYKYQEYEYYCMLSGTTLEYRDGVPFEADDISGFYFELPFPFGDEDPEEQNNQRISIQDDGCLVVSSEYTSEPDDEYSYYSLSKVLYLPKDSPLFDDPEEIRYFDTVTVSSAAELLNAIQNNRKIILEGGVYVLNSVRESAVNNDKVENVYDSYRISNASNLCLEGKEGEEVNILIGEPSEPVIPLYNSSHVVLKNLTVGHDVEPGYCSGSVIYCDGVSDVAIKNCSLYGSGTYGLEAYNSYDIDVAETDIYDCTYGLVSLEGTGLTVFTDCTLRDSGDMAMIRAYGSSSLEFDNCIFEGNRSDAYEGSYFVELDEYDRVAFRNCAFNNNIFNAFSNREVTLENCTTSNNQVSYSDILNSSSDEAPDAETLKDNYDAALNRQAEIDERLKTDALLDQLTLNQLAYEEYDLWDKLLNRIWSYFTENLEEAEMQALRDEQQKWIREKDAAMKEAGADFEGGSMQPMLEYSEGAARTRERVSEFMGMVE